jgi:AraC family transcriptional regulator
LLVHLAKIRSFQAGAISIVRMTSDLSDHEESGLLPQSDAHNIILQLKPFENHRLWRRGNLIYEGGYADGALAITDMTEEWRCHHRSSFDNVRFQFPRQVLYEFSRDAGYLRFARLSEQSGKPDPVVRALAMSLLPSIHQPDQADRMFVDHVLFALQSHLLRHYGDVQLVQKHFGGLSKRQLNLATELLADAAVAELSIANIASACSLSNSYFIRAFKKSTGRTPHRWLAEYRSDKARAMLLGEAPLAQIAIACGFADQSHFTRSFTAYHGISPGRWRREHKR